MKAGGEINSMNWNNHKNAVYHIAHNCVICSNTMQEAKKLSCYRIYSNTNHILISSPPQTQVHEGLGQRMRVQ